MRKRLPLTDKDGEVPELTAADMRLFKPARKVLSPELLAGLKKHRGERGPQKTPLKDKVTMRLSHEVVEHFRATGKGWQTRVDAALKEWMATHQA